MRKQKHLIMSLLLLLTLQNCGGGGGGETSGALQTIEGKAIDGYLENAKVCYDLNDNMKCDEGEPTTETDRNGNFKIKVLPSDFGKHKVVVEAVEGKTKDNGTEINGNFTLYSIKGKYEIVSPFTTLVSFLQEKEGINGTIAEEAIQNLTGIENRTLLLSDYTTNPALESLAKKLTNIFSIVGKEYDLILIVLPKASFSNSTEEIKSEIEKIKDKAEYILNGKTLLGKTIYNFVIDYDNSTGNYWISLRKHVFPSNVSENETTYYYDIDNPITPEIDINVNNVNNLSWERKDYYFSLEKGEKGKLILHKWKNGEEIEKIKILNVSKTDLTNSTIRANFIFVYGENVKKLGLENFTVHFDKGTMYVVNLISTLNNELRAFYAFDENATNQIIEALKELNNSTGD